MQEEVQQRLLEQNCSHYTDLPEAVTRLLWDVDPNTIDLDAHAPFIVERVLNLGDHIALKWVWQKYGRNAIYDTVINSRKLSLKTARCWQNYFDLKEEQMQCFSTFSTSLDRIY